MKAPVNSCLIYVFGETDGSYAKIGKTRKPAEVRRKQHEYRGPADGEMKLLAAVMGHDSDEDALKAHWAHLRLPNRKEWVHPQEDFRAWMRFLRDQPYVACSEAEIDDNMPFVDSRHWLPGAGNTKDLQPQFSFSSDPWHDLDTGELTEGDYYTHPDMISAARAAMGAIDLDPASCRTANRVVQAARFYGAREDGLTRPWHGRVWLNPPFGQWDRWASKAITEMHRGAVGEMCVFATANASTSQRFHRLVTESAAVFIPNGRYGCWGPKSSTATEGNLVFYFGPQTGSFAAAYGRYGTVFHAGPACAPHMPPAYATRSCTDGRTDVLTQTPLQAATHPAAT